MKLGFTMSLSVYGSIGFDTCLEHRLTSQRRSTQPTVTVTAFNLTKP